MSRDRELPKAAHSRPRDRTSVDEHRRIQRKTPPKCAFNCDRNVIRLAKTSKNIEVYGRIPSDSFGTRKSLITCALRRFGVAWCRSRNSLSKRAPSTTRTSLHFRINELRAARHQIIARRLRLPSVSRSYYDSAVYERAYARRRSNCVRPLNLVRSLTAFPRCRWMPVRCAFARIAVGAHCVWSVCCSQQQEGL